jgi:methionyl-tRNA formyltransferase
LKVLCAAAGSAKEPPQASPGTVVTADPKEGLRIQTGKGQLEILELQLEGGKPMPAALFLRGHPLSRGAKLGIP